MKIKIMQNGGVVPAARPRSALRTDAPELTRAG
jgi:hypothetical protein